MKVQLQLLKGIRICGKHLTEIPHIAPQGTIAQMQIIALLAMAIIVLHMKTIIFPAHSDPIVIPRHCRITDKEGSEENDGHDCYDDCPGGLAA